jgi:hypothetical protein
MTLDLTDDDKAALIELLRDMIDRDRFPLSPRIQQLRAILAKLAPALPRPQLLPPPKPSPRPSATLAKSRRRR